MLLSWTITRENANTYANNAPADIAIRRIEPVVTLSAWEQLLATGSGHRAGWALGSKDNRCIAREFHMIKFEHFMLVPNPPFQRSVISESGPKGNLSLLSLCLTLSARTKNDVKEILSSGASLPHEHFWSVTAYAQLCVFSRVKAHWAPTAKQPLPSLQLGGGPFEVGYLSPQQKGFNSHLCWMQSWGAVGARRNNPTNCRDLHAVIPRFCPGSEWKMPRSFLVKSKKAHSYHQHRFVEDDLPTFTWDPITSAFTGESIHPPGI